MIHIYTVKKNIYIYIYIYIISIHLSIYIYIYTYMFKALARGTAQLGPSRLRLDKAESELGDVMKSIESAMAGKKAKDYNPRCASPVKDQLV